MMKRIVILSAGALLVGCATQQRSEETLRQHGYSAAYVAGFHDGCPSGKRAGGDPVAQRSLDDGAYSSNGDYRTGWDYGYLSCRGQERQNEATAIAIGGAIAAGMNSSHGADGIDARDIMSGIDTSGLAALEQ
ncbi:hypothetical protein [Meridianimarinicoccus aquatilis]|uniref:Lipoprotein n=1 Tax=Meridianimarinicoccus aquatilis TaxID=2552766 RepID=A0A4R6AQQ1_9RHOB|nr:hypothetical protein [Fluviibacterium aquatile]QIE40881.1 hypothetical protein G5B39_02240 [Rhodobacteraceae bacterium SC52]TDL84928.1 hypothetical protein E2L05_16725 [Fluviibacterium aquatile]TDL87016.1 hypothetical protein E2L05_11990 [Fluviibacterium aquatile]